MRSLSTFLLLEINLKNLKNGVLLNRVFKNGNESSGKRTQQSVHWTLGILRRFRVFFWLRVFSAPKQNPRPPQRQ
jgi:hypothetical protein